MLDKFLFRIVPKIQQDNARLHYIQLIFTLVASANYSDGYSIKTRSLNFLAIDTYNPRSHRVDSRNSKILCCALRDSLDINISAAGSSISL